MKTAFLPAVSFVGLAAAVFSVSILGGCAKKEPEVEFRPLQIHWIAEAGTSDESMPTKDNCVIRLTARLMGEAPIQASPIPEISYKVIYGLSKDVAGTLDFTGACSDLSLSAAKECNWTASCDKDLNIVVKFHNGD